MAILEPRQSWSIMPATQIAGLMNQRVLIVGQMLATGTATAGELIQDHPNDGSENTLFGRRSHLAGLVREFKEMNGTTQLDIIPLSDATSAVAATGIVTIAGTATAADTLYITSGSEYSYTVKIDVSIDDTATVIGAAIEAAFTALTNAPFTAFNNAGEVTLTASNLGTIPNVWCLKTRGTIAGITSTLTGWNSGATDPTLTTILDVIANIRYRTILWPSSYALTTIEALLNSRFNEEYKIMDGVAVQTKQGTLASLKSYANQNSQSVCVIGNKTVNETSRIGASIMEMPDVISAQFAAFRALKVEEDKSLTQYLTTVASNDQFGSLALSSLPYFNTRLPNLSISNQSDDFTMEEQVELTANGVSVFGSNRSYSDVILGQIVSTYLTNPAGNADLSYKYLETVDTISAIREYFYENFRSRFGQSRLTEGEVQGGRDMVNAGVIRAYCNLLFSKLALETLVQAGTVAKKDFNDNLSISLDLTTGTATISMAPLLVSQLRAVIGTIQVKFSN